MAPIIAGLVKGLIANGLPLIANAVLSKGKEYVEDKIGVKLPDTLTGASEDYLLKLKTAEIEHQEFLITAALDEKRLDYDWVKAESGEITKRWQSDMNSDNKLSKNVRPAVLVYFMILITGLVIGEYFEQRISDPLFEMIYGLGQIVFVAYFGGRTLEKGAQVVREVMTRKK